MWKETVLTYFKLFFQCFSLAGGTQITTEDLRWGKTHTAKIRRQNLNNVRLNYLFYSCMAVCNTGDTTTDVQDNRTSAAPHSFTHFEINLTYKLK